MQKSSLYGSPVVNKITGECSLPSDYFRLLKPRVMSLVIFTAFTGMMLNPGNLHPFLQMISLFAIALGAGASGALNMWYDADIDAIMSRTKNRPIPSGAINSLTARDYGVTLSLFSVILLGLASNWFAAALLVFNIFFYAVIYTIFLKRHTPENIVIGGFAGALPPVIGGAVGTGSVTLETAILCAIIFLWTPPHFWALAILKKDDYKDVNIPMTPNVKGDERTAGEGFAYAFLLYAVSFLPFTLGFAGVFYGVWALITGGVFLALCFLLKKNIGDELKKKKLCRNIFIFSIFYLFSLFAVLFAEKILIG